ncbi:Hypothetical Protein FCC1311_011542 [Hondaea fermentalgiana]|uniref:Uncharacterized protein n=1 Tax=Hondaea fermentalgiana TaxID=2315210 RepID=A0A2R5G1P1_9STRA|nr:Hypothetical Protein FCC1311_011542 [Hondaea fermentalgiana]|eukprot:GBG24937.1 Hypothetical Protein FCC1311_011542 [Hondaea fermentalgiana]
MEGSEDGLARQRQLDALERLCTAVHGMKREVEELNDKVTEVNGAFSRVERKLDAMTLPFQSAVFEFQAQDENRLMNAR